MSLVDSNAIAAYTVAVDSNAIAAVGHVFALTALKNDFVSSRCWDVARRGTDAP